MNGQMSAARDLTPDQLEQIREAARDAAERSSLRQLAPQIGLGHSTLHNFLNGAQPHPRVRGILYRWYIDLFGSPPPSGRVQLDRLTAGMAQEVRKSVERSIALLLARGYVDSGLPVPPWLELGEPASECPCAVR
jgi:hypothetical protein